jgi:hypothetical protein
LPLSGLRCLPQLKQALNSSCNYHARPVNTIIQGPIIPMTPQYVALEAPLSHTFERFFQITGISHSRRAAGSANQPLGEARSSAKDGQARLKDRVAP